MKKHITPAARFIFDAETALKSANLAVLALSSTFKYRIGESDRKEIVAETVAKAWTHRASYDPGKASFPTWVGRIARNTLLDHIRKSRSKDNVAGQADEGILAKAPDILIMEDESLDAVMKAVSSLPESYRRIILLLSEGKSPKEIAGILGCSANAATIKCCRARRALKEKLDNMV